MNDKRPGIEQLVERLLDGSEQRLSAAELDTVLAWLSGSDRHDGDALASRLGHALEHPRRRIAVYDQLDFQLFDIDRLDLAGAHLEAGLADDLRRARYRRLMKAYHPDAYPDHAEWLTPRSQAIHQSYARFRKGQPPEAGAAGAAPEQGQPMSRPAANKRWPGARRSARLTPTSGPGLLSSLRTWLLGIENLQQRILIGLVIVCLVPVLYAYLAYKPYRAIQSPETTADAPAVVEPTVQPVAAPPGDDDSEEPAPESDTRPELAHSLPEPVAPIRPSWERSRAERATGFDRERRPIAPLREAGTEENTPEPDAAAEPTPEASLLELAAWAETIGDTAEQTLAGVANPLADAQEEAPPTPDESQAPEAESGDASDPEIAAAEQVAAAEPARPQAPESREAPGGEEDESVAVAEPPAESSPTDDKAASTAAAPTPDASAETPAEEAPRQESEVAATEPKPAPEQPARTPIAEPEPMVASVSAPATTATEASDEVGEHSRRHIERLLAGYRTSFENGWLDDFLDHFTAEPRENKHSGRSWFRSNYGWLFDNSERRRLALDIMDISRADNHWTAVARFDLQVDYADRPDVHSTRQVLYRIEMNEHEQFRIAAIEY
ncbi:J domain-containing protein [Wenzhouxiangella sp. EGI_FJ10409]|uniref:J domain-containing protein n=1 Tax=Wenzhouxiangella sp. EGI_FJ10409 TaxID=3243767 RepID=UPI0035DB848F